MSDAARQGSVVSANQVLSAGFASAAAAFITSRFGIAGTLLGAALTAMIITGGSAILKAYIENVTGRVRKVPKSLQARRKQRKTERYAEPTTLPERPDLRDNFAGRMRAALGWFSHLPPLMRRSILMKGLIAAAVAFVIGMGAVYAVEKGIGNSLSCGLWSKCPDAAKPGIHLVGDRGTGAEPSISLSRAKTKVAPGYQENGNHLQRQAPSQLQRQAPSQQEVPGVRQDYDYQRPAPSDSGVRLGGGLLKPDQPAEPQVSSQQQDTPSSASPAPEEKPVQEGAPSGASPAPSPSGASPAPSQ